MCVVCDVSGPGVDDCSKNGKKAAEAMSLSKDGKSAHYHVQEIVMSIVVWDIWKENKHKLVILLVSA